MAQQQPERSMEARVGRDKQRYSPNGVRLVAGVVPLSADKTQVLLIQSSARKGWVLPKGGWETDEPSAADAARREAWEEAGIECEIIRDLGEIAESGSRTSPRGPCMFQFYEVLVTTELADWPERHKRDRRWMSYTEAREMLRSRPELGEALERSGIVR